MTREQILAIAHEGLLLGHSPILRHNPAGRHAQHDGYAFTSWGPHGPAVNKIAVTGTAPSLNELLAVADDFFGTEPGGFGVVVEADAGHPIEAELQAAGWEVFEDEPALVLTERLPAQPQIKELVIQRVGDDTTRNDLAKVLHAGFGDPTAEMMPELSEEAMESLVPSLACANDPDVALLIGYFDGQPAASAFLFVIGPIAGITGVATVPQFRRRGLAMALTAAAIDAGIARGCEYTTLAGLGASFDLYRKMGFVHVCNHRAYQKPTVPA